MSWTTCSKGSLTNKLRFLLIILIFAGGQLLLTLHLRMSSGSGKEPNQEKLEEFSPKLFEIMSFGQLPAMVDWIWLKTLQDPFIDHVKKGTHPAIYYSLDLLTRLDPAYFDSYIAGATLVSVIRDDGPGALHLLERGEEFRTKELPKYDSDFRDRYWSPEWRLPLLLGYVYLFDLDDLPHAEEAYRTTAAIPGSPPYLQALLQQLGQRGGRYQVSLRLLELMITTNAKDVEVRNKLIARRESLRVSYYLFDLNEKYRDYISRLPGTKAHKSSIEFLRSAWENFRTKFEVPATDPWGGTLSLNSEGTIVTTTEHHKVFGIE